MANKGPIIKLHFILVSFQTYGMDVNFIPGQSNLF